jgi:hypothetical protein
MDMEGCGMIAWICGMMLGLEFLPFLLTALPMSAETVWNE